MCTGARRDSQAIRPAGAGFLLPRLGPSPPPSGRKGQLKSYAAVIVSVCIADPWAGTVTSTPRLVCVTVASWTALPSSWMLLGVEPRGSVSPICSVFSPRLWTCTLVV